MQVGTVIRWDNFPSPQFGGTKKPRWFLCLGKTSKLSTPIKFYLHSTTTTKRINIRHFFFTKNKYGFFKENCCLNFNERPYPFPKSQLNNRDIHIIGYIDKNDLRLVFDGIKKEQRYTRMELLDIYNSLTGVGIEGLTKP